MCWFGDPLPLAKIGTSPPRWRVSRERMHESINEKDLRSSLRLACLVPRGINFRAFWRARYACLLVKTSKSPGLQGPGAMHPLHAPSWPAYLFSWRTNGTLGSWETLEGEATGNEETDQGIPPHPHHPPTDHPPHPGTNHVDGKAKVCTSQTPDPNLGPTLMFQVTFPRILT